MSDRPADSSTSSSTSYAARLQREIDKRFDLGEIQGFCFDLGIDFDNLKGEIKEEKIRHLIFLLGRANRLAELVALCRERIPELSWEDPPPPQSTLSLVLPPGEEGETVERGFEALSELMTNPEARTAVIAFRTDFEAANSQIDTVSNYKEVHDMLHTLELQGYNTMRQAARLFPDDEITIDTLYAAEVTLQQIITTLSEIATRPSFGANELGWIKDLERAMTHLGNALNDEDSKQLQRATWLISRVVAIQPSQINTRLNAVARSLRLQEIVRAMTTIHDKLESLNMDPGKLESFLAGALSLAKLNFSLNELVEGHDSWQAIILEMRRIESGIDQDSFELEMSWPDLKMMLAPLLEENPDEEWVGKINQHSSRLDEAIDGGNPARMKRFFRQIDRLAGSQFYLVDIALRQLCEDLRRVGQPLAAILKILE